MFVYYRFVNRVQKRKATLRFSYLEQGIVKRFEIIFILSAQISEYLPGSSCAANDQIYNDWNLDIGLKNIRYIR